MRVGWERTGRRIACQMLVAMCDAQLAVREALVRTRTRYISIAKSLVRRDGLRVAGSESHLVAKRIEALEISDTLAIELTPLFTILAPINEQIATADRELAVLCKVHRSAEIHQAPDRRLTAACYGVESALWCWLRRSASVCQKVLTRRSTYS